MSGSNQFVLLIGSAIAASIGFINKVPFEKMILEISENLKSSTNALLILLMVGALSGTWLVSGVIPTMVFYGLKILDPSFFLLASLLICAIISLATGSSWGTSATVGIALIGIGESLGISSGMTAGAVLSGAYFGDKMSPMSDTTNLAPAMAGSDLFSHIRYMTITTIPTFILTLIIFTIIGFNLNVDGNPNLTDKLDAIENAFNVTPLLMFVPGVVIFLIYRKTPALVALFIGVIVAGVASIFFQPNIIVEISNSNILNFNSAYKGVMQSITVDTSIETASSELNDLLSSGGMKGMLGTVWLIICAMVFGGVMASCLALNITASDQYLAIVIPGKMFKKAYENKGLAPENLSRTLEDSGTVTSVLIPWNTCGAYQSSVLGVSVADYFIYAFFNWISPFMTLFIAALGYKIKLNSHQKDLSRNNK